MYAFGTYALPNAKTYFAETGTGLLVALSCYAAIRSWESGAPRHALLSGVAVGAAFLVRPSAGLFMPVIGLAIVLVGVARRGPVAGLARGLWYALGAIVMLACHALLSWWRFGSPTDLGYPRVPQDNPLLSGLTGQLWSTGKGIVWYAPIVVLSVLGAALSIRRHPATVSMLASVALANTLFFARVPYWPGDAAWGPRYTLIVLPVLVPLAAGVLTLSWGLRAIQVAGVVGFLSGAIPGALVNPNTLYIRADAESAVTQTRPDMRNDLDWQPILRNYGMLPEAIRDVIGDDRPGELDREGVTGAWGFYGYEPRPDVWWLWIGPTGASGVTWVFLLAPAAALGSAGYLSYRDRRRMSGDGQPGYASAEGAA